MTDEVDAQLKKLEESLIRSAEKAGEGPTTARKSKFQSVMEKDSFIKAFGQSAYDALKE